MKVNAGIRAVNATFLNSVSHFVIVPVSVAFFVPTLTILSFFMAIALA
jgi:hypothetical protein